jgi:hypothetical protein
MNAYDYTNQRWIEGEPARQLLLSQLRDEIALLHSPDGDNYARMINADRNELLRRSEADLESLEKTSQK